MGVNFFIPRLIFRMVRWLRQFLPRQRTGRSYQPGGRSEQLFAGLVMEQEHRCFAYVTVEGQTVLSGFRMTVIAGVFFCSILFVLSAVCKDSRQSVSRYRRVKENPVHKPVKKI